MTLNNIIIGSEYYLELFCFLQRQQ